LISGHCLKEGCQVTKEETKGFYVSKILLKISSQKVSKWFSSSFLPSSQETCEGKVTQLYSGFGYEQIVKMAWTSLLLQPMVIWRPWHLQLRFFTRELVAVREQPIVHQKVWRKVPPIHPKKTDFGWWDTDTYTPIGCRKGTEVSGFVEFSKKVLKLLA